MRKILSIIGTIIFIGVILTILGTCSGSCSGCRGKTQYFELVRNDGTDDSSSLDIKTARLNNYYMTREGYTFLGVFSTAKDGVQYYDNNGNVVLKPKKGDVLFIQWEINKYDFVFLSGDKEVYREYDITYGSTVYNFPILTYDSDEIIFEGWKDANGKLVSDENGVPLYKTVIGEYYTLNDQNKTVTLTDSYKLKTYEVTFAVSVTSEERVVEVSPNTALEELPELNEIEGYEFLGWSYTDSVSYPEYYNGEPITKDTTLYAIFVEYKEIKLMNGSEVLKTERVYDNGKALNLDTLEIDIDDGYEIVGWYSNQTMSGSSRVNSANFESPFTEYYADIRPITYTISFVMGKGEICDSYSLSYNIESQIELPKASKENYEFIGWCTDVDCETMPITIVEKGTIGNFNLYPKFKGKDIKLTLNSNNGDYPTSSTKEFGKDYKLNVPVYDGYLFLGWFDENGTQYTDEEGNSIKPLSFTENSTLYAHWDKKYFVNVSVIPQNAGEVEVKEYYLENEKVTLNFPTPIGYSMIGWFDGNDVVISSSEQYTFTMPSRDVNLTLKLEPKTFMVNLVSPVDAEFDKNPIAVTYGEPFKLPKAVKENYKFIGWHYNGKFLTDGEGQSLENWNITENITLSAFFVNADEKDGILIYDPATLLAMKNDPSATYQVVFDIDMMGVEWEPFDFMGTLIGNTHTISNLTISPDKAGNTGMFSNLSGTVQDLNFDNLNVTLTQTDYTNYYAVGGVCGTLTGGTLNKVTIASGKIEGGTTFNYAGGLVGSMTGGSITSCKNYAQVVSTSDYGTGGIVARLSEGTLKYNNNYGEVTGKQYTGGIIGYADMLWDQSITDLTNFGEINGLNYVGGVAGFIKDYVNVNNNENPVYTLTLNKLTNTGTIVGESNVGGVIGKLEAYGDNSKGGKDAYVKIDAANLKNTGDITGTTFVGGLMGSCYSDSKESLLTNGSVSATIKGLHHVGGLAGKIENVKIASSFNNNTIINATGFYLDTENSTYYAYVGGYAGYGFMFENCDNASEIIYTQKGNYVGGITGYAEAINNCTNTGKISAISSNYVGGIAGYIYLEGDCSLTNLTNEGKITGNNYVGGIAGQVKDYVKINKDESPTYTLTLTNLTNNGVITGKSDVGGTIGRLDAYGDNNKGGKDAYVKINASYMTNTVNITGAIFVGGLIGSCHSDSNESLLTNGTVKGTITGEYYVGGLAGKIENVKISNSTNANTKINATGFYLDIDNSTYYAYVGGYAGYGYAFDNCENNSDITYTEKGNYIGGIVGYANGAIDNCTNTGDIITSDSDYVGGIAGSIYLLMDNSINVLTNSGRIKGKNYVGGIAGNIIDYAKVNNDGFPTYTFTFTSITNEGAVTGETNVGGIAGKLEAYADNTKNGKDAYVKIVGAFITNSGNIAGKSRIGGLFGYAASDSDSSSIIEYSQTGKVIGNGENVGNLIGYISNISFVS